MLAMALFEIDLVTQELIFPQAGLLENYVEPNRPYGHDVWLKKFIEEMVLREDQETALNALQIQNYMGNKGRVHCEFRLYDRESGTYQWVYVNAMRSHDCRRAVGTIENIHQQKQEEQELKFQAEHDTLTKLWNRSAFQCALDEEIQKPGSAGMYAFLDIDDFKKINDTLGHRYGDWLLMEVSAALKKSLPDFAVIGRYGGDEFMFYLPGVTDRAEAAGYAQQALDAVSAIKPDQFQLSTSIGVSFYPAQGTSMEGGVAACADIAMYQAKTRGKKQVCIYEPSMGKGLEGQQYRARKKHKPRGRVQSWLRGNRASALALLLGGLLLVVTLSLLTGTYTKELQDVVNEESDHYLEEISAQMNASLVKGMNSNYAILDSLATKVEQSAGWPKQEILSDLARQASIFNFRQIALIDSDGNWHTVAGEYAMPELLPSVSKMIKTRMNVTTRMVSIFQEDCVVFLCPMNQTTVDGRKMVGIAAVADMNMLNNLLYLTLFDGAGYSHVVTDKGEAVIRSVHETSVFLGDNLLQHLKGAVFYDGVSAESIAQDFQQGASRKIRFQMDGQELMAIYAPVGYDDWYLFTVIPSNVLNEKTSSFYRLTALSCVVISVLFLLLFAAIFLLHNRSRRNLVKQLYTDPVTGGPSKIKFEQEVEGVLNASEHRCSMIYANVEKFKLINERDGSEAGDRLLAQIYQIIAQDLDEPEIVARLMADHFGILAATQNMAFLKRRIEAWNRKIQEHAQTGKFTTLVTMNYGVLPISEPKEKVSLMLDKANLARKTASSEEGLAVYDTALSSRLQLETELESRQEQALENQEFKVYFQPKYCPKTNRIAGAEALVRWLTPDKGMLMPDTFIPLFESNGFIVKLDLYVFDQACRFLWKMREDGLTPIPVSVNLSRANLSNPDFLTDYVKVWAQYHLDASLLEFEITETLVYENMERLNDLLDDIHRYGFLVSMDDFGSGYSSLNMLKNVNIDIVKLDREFFDQKDSIRGKALLIVKRLIELAKDLGMSVVAEGVETQDMVDFLRAQDCDMIQGYYYSRPVAMEEMRRLAEEGQKT